MEQNTKVEKFLNWILDNNFSEYIKWFKTAFDIEKDTYIQLKHTLMNTNVVDFVNIVKNGVSQQDWFEYDLLLISWAKWCEGNITIGFEDGEYIKYTVENFGVKADYIAIVKMCDGNTISEYCEAVINADDEELMGQISYYENFDINVCFSNFRLANENEIKWLNNHLKECDGVVFNKNKKELVEIA